jgi:hypothetical protein
MPSIIVRSALAFVVLFFQAFRIFGSGGCVTCLAQSAGIAR